MNNTANGKACKMMSNFNGILELYQLTGDPQILSTMEIAWKAFVTNHLYITGTCSQGGHFQDNSVLPAENTGTMGDVCVSTTWFQYNQALCNLTRYAEYIDEIKETIYNHLLAAENPLTGSIGYYTALQGEKLFHSEINGYYCLASVPQSIAAIPELVYAKFVVNYCSSL